MAEPKLTSDQRAEILRRYAAGEQQKVLARDYGVGESTIRRICTRNVSAFKVVSENREQTYRENLNWASPRPASSFAPTRTPPSARMTGLVPLLPRHRRAQGLYGQGRPERQTPR